MNLDVIKRKVSCYLNRNATFVYKGSRGQVERFSGSIIKLYPRIFIVKTNKSIIKSFSYSDFAIGNVKIMSC